MAGRYLRDSRSCGISAAFAALLVVACATSSKHEKSAADETNYGNLDDHTGEIDEKPAPKPDDNVRQRAGDAKRSDEATPAQGDDLHAVLQLTVEDAELDQYLKLGEPGRFPLKIAGSSVPPNVELMKATKPVVVSAPPASKKDAVLVFTDIDIKGNDATVSYRYDIEGIRGTAYLKKTPHGWELTRSRIVEH